MSTEILKIEGKPTLYSYNVLKTATKNFHMASKLGEGGFGAVYKVHIHIYLLLHIELAFNYQYCNKWNKMCIRIVDVQISWRNDDQHWDNKFRNYM
jgi:hypothetical protein